MQIGRDSHPRQCLAYLLSKNTMSFTHEDDTRIYDEVYTQLTTALKNLQYRSPFQYRGVDLIWCLKRELFFYAYRDSLKCEIIKKGNQKDSAILEHSPSHHFPRKKWGISLKRGSRKKAKTVIFSDYAKTKNIIDSVNDNAIFYANSFSPKLYLISLFKSFPFYQIASTERNLQQYVNKASCYYKELLRHKPFFAENAMTGALQMEPLLRPKIEQLFKDFLPHLLFEIDEAHRFFEGAPELKTALLDEDTTPFKNAFCQVARHYDVRSFVECHGALGHKIGFLPLTADHIFVWGEAQKEKMIRWGCPKEQILISGCSKYGRYKKMKSENAKKKVIKNLGLDPTKKMILFAFTPIKGINPFFIERTKQIIDEALSAIEYFPEFQFVIKVHPGDEYRPYYENWRNLHPYSNRIFVVERYDSLLLAKAADLLIVYNSTYAIDGFALRKPVICLYDAATTMIDEFREFNVFHYVDNLKTLLKTIQTLIDEPYVPPSPETFRTLLNEGEDPEKIIVSYLLSTTY